MLDLHKPPAGHDTKTYLSHSCLPSYIDAAHPPGKKTPFRAFAALAHAHAVDLVLPPEIWDVVRAHLAELDARVYARVYLSLSDVLADDFLDAYVRNGSASMLAAGRDTRVALVGGVLRLIPLTGITLPFVSYGGSSLLANFILLALLLLVSNRALAPRD